MKKNESTPWGLRSSPVSRPIKKESKYVNRDWVEHQTCRLSQYNNVITNRFYKDKIFYFFNSYTKSP